MSEIKTPEMSEAKILLNHLDAILARLESAIHGHYGDELTEARGLLRKIENQFPSQQEVTDEEIEKLKRLAHQGLPDQCISGWDEVKFCEHRQADGNECKLCSNYQ